MDYLNDIISAVAVLIAAFAAWLSRSASKKTRRAQKLEDVVAKSIDAGVAHRVPGIPLAKTCLEFAVLLDLEDGKRDFADRKLYVEIVAELARRKLV
jgi:hypothetical protein